jgi:peptide/nickel transport system ATP-binding protein
VSGDGLVSDDVLLRAHDVRKHFPVRGGGALRRTTAVLRAVDGVSLEVRRGETLGLVGESGCGKSTLGRCLMRLTPLSGGTVEIEGRDISSLSARQLRPIRRQMQMVFQDPYSSLNPRQRVRDIVALPLRVHRTGSRREVAARVGELLELVGLRPEHADRFPHEFSGGQRQRIGIARALALEPRLLIADEPVSALDVSVQAQVVNLLAGLRDELGLACLLIAHDLSVVRQVSDRIAVMYLGRVVEVGAAEAVIARPAHPYAEALVSAVPVPDPERAARRERIILSGDVPSPASPPSGCHFHPRCRYATDRCRTEDPALREVAPGRLAACHYPRIHADD